MPYDPNERWYCFTCNSNFTLGEAKLGGRPGRGWCCPACDSDNTMARSILDPFLRDYHGIKAK